MKTKRATALARRALKSEIYWLTVKLEHRNRYSLLPRQYREFRALRRQYRRALRRLVK